MRFKDRYRVEPTRLRGWEYTSPGMYFITICTRELRPYFGEILQGAVQLTPLGETAQDFWEDLP